MITETDFKTVKASEVRIGNTLLFVDFPARGTMTVDAGIISDMEKFPDNHTWYGITLTADLLKKCGFEYNERTNLWYNGIAVRHVPGGITYLYWECSDPYYDEDGIAITSVHQLQNLHFALTGEELNFMP